MKIARFIKIIPNDFQQVEQALYLLDEPLWYEMYNPDTDSWYQGPSYQYVAVSASRMAFLTEPETFIFGCDADGENWDFHELPGSTKGTLQHSIALKNAGYEIRFDLKEGGE